MIDIHIAKNKGELEDCFEVRRKVFIEGQGVPEKIERDGRDNEADHAILYFNNKPAGTARIRYLENNMRLERISVLKEKRGRGLGKELTKFLVKYGREKGVNEINMHAQYYLLNFYEGLGFSPRGKKFSEAGMDHIEMFMTC